MRSPFPGMDPYLEAHWGDVHHRLITYACDALQARLPGGLLARVEERVFVEVPVGPKRPVVPDLRVLERRRAAKAGAETNGGVAIAEPLVVTLDEPITEGFIEIRDAKSGHRVVTVMEILSLTNKLPGAGRNEYIRKQRELIEGGVNLVEIDLLRAGKSLLPFPLERLPESHRTPYRVCVRRCWEPIDAEVYRMPLRERLPVIGIPLRPADADVPLDLQELVERCYANGAYGEDINYRRRPDPPLGTADARWAASLLRKRGRRK